MVIWVTSTVHIGLGRVAISGNVEKINYRRSIVMFAPYDVVRLEVPVEGVWHDISLQTDQQLGITSANRRYAECVATAQARLRGAQAD